MIGLRYGADFRQQWIVWFDAATGREAVERRLSAPGPMTSCGWSRPEPFAALGSSGRLVVCRGEDRPGPSAWRDAVGRVLGLPGPVERWRSVVIDSQTGAVAGEGEGHVLPDSYAGRLVLVDYGDRLTVWRLPPPDLPARVAGLAAGWGLVVGLAARWWGRRRGA